MSFNGQYKILENNFIYFYHLKKYFILPIYPEQIAEQLSSKFAENNAISRSAPVFSYIQSGPRTVQISLSLHRDMFKDIPNFSELPDISKYGLTNPDNSGNISLTGRLRAPFSTGPVGDPYIGVNISGVDSDTNKALYKFDKDAVDTLISYLQASSLPSYSNSNNIYTVTPPMVALNFGGIGDSAGKGIVIKGIINSGISVN